MEAFALMKATLFPEVMFPGHTIMDAHRSDHLEGKGGKSQNYEKTYTEVNISLFFIARKYLLHHFFFLGGGGTFSSYFGDFFRMLCNFFGYFLFFANVTNS